MDQLLSAIVLACLVPGVVLAGWLIFLDVQERKARQVDETLARSRAVITSVDRELVSIQSTLSALATSPHLQSRDFESFRAQAAIAIKTMQSTNLGVASAQGQQLVNLLAPAGQPLPPHGNPALIRRVVESNTPQVSDLFIARLTGKPVVTVSVPVPNPGPVEYVLSGSVPPQVLTSLLVQQRLPATWIATVLDSKGTVVGRTRNIDSFLGVRAGANLLAAMEGRSEGSLLSNTLDGTPVSTVFVKSPLTDWTAVIAIPLAESQSRLNRAVALAVGVCLLLLLSGMGVAAVVGRRISRSITSLSGPARSIGSGSPIELPPLAFEEAQELGAALVEASQALQRAGVAVSDGEAKLAAIVDSALDAIITIDDEQKVMLFNAAAVAMFGWQREEIVGRPVDLIIPPRWRASNPGLGHPFGLDGAARRSVGSDGRAFGLRRTGEEFPIEASISRLRQADRYLLTVIVRDISQRVAHETALVRSNEDLKQFAYVASHDLKAPLRSINGFVRLLERGYSAVLDDKGRDLLSRTSRAAVRLERLTDDLLVFARLDAELPPMLPMDFREVVDDALQLMDAAIEGAQARVTVGPMPVVMGGKSELVHLMLNLLGNAIKYRSEERPPEVSVTATQDGRSWVFAVKDNGIGIASEHFSKIFEVFNRLHGTSRFEGSGIGLALCRRIVERHNGTIWVESTEGAGSTFHFSLPAA
ncbi:sensor histidine kinase [Caenimonas aquaedulcis]|uniref:histidine kinase n=1 Tax=Caenimonas aquaedulcis TaxID=2793270 RepID=A0A931H8E8_9BURK|nr:ATP-binding protein [Caenimonas aquaedulcis]MBG9390624.1 PAS domain S-box protein [Caenimonas aquaedulcis]